MPFAIEDEAPWLRHSPRKLEALIQEFMEWRHFRANLSGSDSRYDQILGCYGNPRAKKVLVAEIPEVRGIDEALARRRDEGGDIKTLWEDNWNVSDGDKLFRSALVNRQWIPSIDDNHPWTWKCWITNFVKRPTRTNFWHGKPNQRRIDPTRKGKILEKSANYLHRELRLINPELVVIMGNSVENYFRKYRKTIGTPEEVIRKVTHYARQRGKDEEYLRKFDEGLMTRWTY